MNDLEENDIVKRHSSEKLYSTNSFRDNGFLQKLEARRAAATSGGPVTSDDFFKEDKDYREFRVLSAPCAEDLRRLLEQADSKPTPNIIYEDLKQKGRRKVNFALWAFFLVS